MDKKYPLEELAELPEFYHPVVSPQGDKVAFYWDKSGRNELYVMDLDDGEVIQISDGNVPKNARWFLVWDYSGEKVYYHYDDSGNEQNDIYSIDMDGDVEKVIDIDGQGIIQDVSKDGRYILYTSDEGEQMNLYRYDLDKEEKVKLTGYEQPVMGAYFSPSDEWIVYRTNESDDLENKDIYLCRFDGSSKRKLDIGEEGSETSPADWRPSGDKILISDNSRDMVRCGIYDIKEDFVEWYGEGEYEERPIGFTPDGEGFLALRVKDAAWMPVYYSTEGFGKELELDEGMCFPPLQSRDGVFLDDSTFITMYAKTDSKKELYKYNLENDEFDVVLQADYGNLNPEVFVEGEYVTYESYDGLDIGAVLYDSGERPSPAVVHVHGGPHGQAMKGFDLYAQFLVSRGYTVLQPNYRGSIGRGKEFKRMIHMDWGGKEQEDIAAGTEWLKEKDWIDEDRVAVFGGSYGGYSTYMQMVKYPEMYRTGVAWVGITDLHKLYEEDMPHFQAMLEEQMGDPDDNHELWRDRSPIEHIENMKRPILMIHGVNDPRCPFEQAEIFKEGLEDMGWEEGEDFEFEPLKEEGHGSTDISQKIRAFQILEDYLDRRM